MIRPLSRRELLIAGAAASAGAMMAWPRPSRAARLEDRPLTVYCSADADLAQPIIDAFKKKTGLEVLAVFDTEATKTTGLVNRLLTEKSRPRAHVWWSSEPFGTIRLARASVLEPYTSTAAESAMKAAGGWPDSLRATDRTWYGFGSRARVIAYNSKALPDGPGATTLFTLAADARFNGRIGIARPQFGTTRGHMAAYATRFKPDGLRRLLKALKAADVRLLDGNAAVARAVGTGQIHVGLTDSDDVFAGQKQGWPIAMRFEERTQTIKEFDNRTETDGGLGPLFFPNTIGVVNQGPGVGRTASPGAFVDFILSPDVQRTMAASESRNIPVDPALRDELSAWSEGGPARWPQEYETIANNDEQAMRICEEVLG